MKIRTNFGRLMVAVLGVTLYLSHSMSAGERPKNARTPDHRPGALTGRLTGTLGNQVVPGASETVTLTPLSPPGAQALTIKTDAEGRFRFAALVPGEYELKTQLNWTTTYIEENDDGSIR